MSNYGRRLDAKRRWKGEKFGGLGIGDNIYVESLMR